MHCCKNGAPQCRLSHLLAAKRNALTLCLDVQVGLLALAPALKRTILIFPGSGLGIRHHGPQTLAGHAGIPQCPLKNSNKALSVLD